MARGNASGRRSRADVEAEIGRRRALALALRAAQVKGEILQRYAWDFADICEDSPRRLDNRLQQAGALLSLFEPTDMVWAGEPMHSIAKEDVEGAEKAWRREVARHFRKAGDWVSAAEAGELPGSRICGCAFNSGTQHSRSLEAVARQRFLVIEHDHLSLDEQGAMLRWLRDGAGLRLRAILFTGGKSLHGWFDFPADPREAWRLKLMLCGLQEEQLVEGRTQRRWRGGLGFDAASWNAVQPWKVPGWPHPKTQRMCELVWLEDAPARKDSKGGAR
jgi:hypothetical protein